MAQLISCSITKIDKHHNKQLRS